MLLTLASAQDKMATVTDIPFNNFHMSTLVKLGSLSKQMFFLTSDDMITRNRPEEICSYIRQLATFEQKREVVTSKLTNRDKWDLCTHLSGRNVVFPSFDMLTFVSHDIRERNGERRTLIKEWEVPDMSKACHFTHMATTCKEFYEELNDEWDCTYGFDYDDPAENESLYYGWAVSRVYFNVLNVSHRTCKRTQMFDMGTNKQAPSFFLFDQEDRILDSVLLYLLG